MAQAVDTVSRTLCCTCLSTDRNVVSLNNLTHIYQIFRLIMDDYSDIYSVSIKDSDQVVCWECLAIMKKIYKFKKQVHNAQEHLKLLAMKQFEETMDQTTSYTLSSLKCVVKTDYDKVVDCTNDIGVAKCVQHTHTAITITTSQNDKESYNVVQKEREHISEIDDHEMLVPEIVLENPVTGVTSQVSVNKKEEKTPPKPNGLRKFLSKTTLVGYKCLECNMFFKTSKDRHNHARVHKEKLQCDHCKKAFVNRTVLIAHLRLHEGPLPREECPVCHKMVRSLQIKYHIQRHQNTNRYECKDCDKIFSHWTTYQGHLKYSRRHASELVLKFPCPMCNKGYPTKQTMQDHFNYQHLGKTTHKCPVCSKPIASQANVERHMRRVHSEKKQKPRNHVCAQCGKAFTDKKDLLQHEAIHSGERPLSCELCQQTFKQKASLYTHRKRVHKVLPAKRPVQFMEAKADG